MQLYIFERSNFHIFSCLNIDYELKEINEFVKNTSLGDRMDWKKVVWECATWDILARMNETTGHEEEAEQRE